VTVDICVQAFEYFCSAATGIVVVLVQKINAVLIVSENMLL